MAVADANKAPLPGEIAASSVPIMSISPSDEAAAAIEEQLAGLGLTVAAGFEPSGWEDGPAPVAGDEAAAPYGKVQHAGFELSGWEDGPDPVVCDGDEVVPDDKVQAAVSSPAADERVRFPRRPGEPDCGYYIKFGTCRFGTKCKFNHPARKKKSRMKGSVGSGSNSSSNKASSPDYDQGFDDKGSASNSIQGPNHKRRTYTPENHSKTSYEIPRGLKDKRKETVTEGGAREKCKYYGTPGGCKFGEACKYLHCEGKEGKAEAVMGHLNFLGLPLRPGEKECSYYMRTGSCKYATYCKFHHPDPSNVSSKEPVLEHENGVTPQQHVQGPSQTSAPIWPDQRSMNEQHVPFLAPAQSYNAGMMPPQGVYPSPDWTGYHQVPLNPYYPPGVPFQHFTAPLSHPMYKTADIPGHQQVATDVYPERPGQPECQHFVRSGFCKYKMKCRYHHPRSQLAVPQPTGLSPLGLPIKPDQPVCTYYGRFGVCKYGPACMFNHPFNFGPPVHAAGPPVPGQYPTLANFTV